jgi:growth hormone secretagogue receptor
MATNAMTTGVTGLVPSDYFEYKLSRLLWTYVSPFLVFFGLLFNALIIVVLVMRKFGKASTRMLLIALAIADSGALCPGLIWRWLGFSFGIELQRATPASCNILFFFYFLAKHASSFLIMSLTIERWISVCFPLRASTLCTRKKTAYALTGLCLFIFVFNIHIAIFPQFIHKMGWCWMLQTPYFTKFWHRIWYGYDSNFGSTIFRHCRL